MSLSSKATTKFKNLSFYRYSMTKICIFSLLIKYKSIQVINNIFEKKVKVRNGPQGYC